MRPGTAAYSSALATPQRYFGLAMSEENLEIVRRIWDADASRDAATILALYDPQVEWDMSQFPLGTLSRRAVYHGHEGLRDWFREWTEAWDKILIWEDVLLV
jgi:ketosteroid isomerase-like protein